MPYPSSIDSFAGFTSTDTLAHDNHASQENQQEAAIIAVETKLGIGVSIPSNNTVLRGNGSGTAFDQVHATTDISGVLLAGNGGTGISSLGANIPTFLGTPTSANLSSAVTDETGSGSLVFANGPSFVNATGSFNQPTITDFTNANHNHQNIVGGGQLNAANALQSSSITYGLIGSDSSFAFVDYSASSTIIGWTSFTTKVVKYFKFARWVVVIFDIAGTSNSTSTSFTVAPAQQGTPATVEGTLGLALDNGGAGANTGRISMISNVISMFTNNAGGGWTASGTKEVRGQFMFESAT